MKEMKSKMSVLFFIVFVPMILLSTAHAVDVDSNSTDSNSSDMNITVIDNNNTDSNSSDMNITVIDNNNTDSNSSDINITNPTLDTILSHIQSLDFLAHKLDINTSDVNMSDINMSLPPMDANITKPDNNITLGLMNKEVEQLHSMMSKLFDEQNMTDESNISLSLMQIEESLSSLDEIKMLISPDANRSEYNITIIQAIENLRHIFQPLMPMLYSLNDTEITDNAIIDAIKKVIADLDLIQRGLPSLADHNDTNLSSAYDMLKHDIDGAMSSVDAVMSVIDDLNISNEDKEMLKAEALLIKDAIEALKPSIDSYKADNNNSQMALEMLDMKIQSVIALLSAPLPQPIMEVYNIDIPKGRSVISAYIDVSKLPDAIYAVWIVDGGNWYGYSPDEAVRADINASYRLIEGIIPPYKATIVWAKEDTNITLENDSVVENATQYYGSNFSIHGANNQDLSVDDIVCANEKGLSAIFKVHGEETAVYVPEREIEEIENFNHIYHHEGYYTLCETILGGTNE